MGAVCGASFVLAFPTGLAFTKPLHLPLPFPLFRGVPHVVRLQVGHGLRPVIKGHEKRVHEKKVSLARREVAQKRATALGARGPFSLFSSGDYRPCASVGLAVGS